MPEKTVPEFEVWNQLLQQYVDASGRVDYAAWKVESAPRLKDWLAQVAKADLVEHPERSLRLAFWLNLYNALVIDQVLARYPIASIRPMVLGIPNWLAFLRFFQRPVYQTAGRRYSLNQIEHGILRSEFREPRIHFALVCAAVGCPLLRAEAYWPEQVEQQLEADAVRFIQNPANVRSVGSILNVSQIFKWYQKDFLQHHPTVRDYIQLYLPSQIHPAAQLRYLDYDWSLNQRT
jgi:hypothetical protein